MHFSVSEQILAVILTTAAGLTPLAVAFDKTIASAPSRTAQATSDASARVGLDDRTIDSNIWVELKTGLAAIFDFSIIHFYAIKTFSGGISDPKSLLEINIPSAADKISSKLFKPY
jgi:hypothetical protein